MGTTLAAGAGLTAVGLIASRVGAAPFPQSPSQNSFFKRARDNFKRLRNHENDHVEFLVGALGVDARPMPNFVDLEQPSFSAFATVSRALENTGVGAYLGAAPYIQDSGYLAAAASIALIEARHAGWLNTFLGKDVTDGLNHNNQSFESDLSIAAVVDSASPFIVDLNGGPPLTFSTTPSPQNDIDILNFALALEYLEAEYYNVNVPVFF